MFEVPDVGRSSYWVIFQYFFCKNITFLFLETVICLLLKTEKLYKKRLEAYLQILYYWVCDIFISSTYIFILYHSFCLISYWFTLVNDLSSYLLILEFVSISSFCFFIQLCILLGKSLKWPLTDTYFVLQKISEPFAQVSDDNTFLRVFFDCILSIIEPGI